MTESNGCKIGQAHLNDFFPQYRVERRKKKFLKHTIQNISQWLKCALCNNRIIKTLCFHLFTKDFENISSNINLFHPHNIAHLRLYSLSLSLALWSVLVSIMFLSGAKSYELCYAKYIYKKFIIMMEISTIKL